MTIQKHCVLFSCVTLFIFLSLLHYLTQRPLWLDEEYLLINMQAFDYLGLFKVLKHEQIFPRVYLVMIRFLGELTNYHVLALRFLPLVAMIGAYFIWFKLYKKSFKDEWISYIAIGTFSASYYMTYYAAELKAYSMDVLVVGLLTWFAIEQKKFLDKKPTPNDYRIYHFLPFSLLISYSAIYIIPIIALNFFLLILVEKKQKLWLMFLTYSFLSLVAFGLAYSIDIRFSAETRGLFNNWKDMFLYTTSIGAFMDPFWEGLRDMATWWYGKGKFFIRAGSPLIGVFLYGVVRHGFLELKKDGFKIFSIGSVFTIVFLEIFVLSILHQFPFTGARVTLFMAPMIFYLTAKTIEDMKRIKPLYYIFGGYYVVYLMMCVVNSVVIYYKMYQT